MGKFGEHIVSMYGLNCELQYEFSKSSFERSLSAIETGDFKDEITPVTVKSRNGEVKIDTDEEPAKSPVEKIPQLRPAFAKDGTITAASSSKISDGAAAFVLMRRSDAEAKNIRPLARIVAHATHSHEPEWFTTAPVGEIGRAACREREALSGS